MSKDTPTALVKYLDAESGMEALAEGSLPWIAPHLFNDPFENSVKTPLGFDASALQRALIHAISTMIFAFDEPSGPKNNPIKRAVRRWRAEDRFHTEEEVESALLEVVPSMTAQRFVSAIAYMGQWQSFARDVRVLSLNVVHDLIHCWELLADEHRGLAIKFQCGDGAMVSEPRRVRYRPNRLAVTSLKEQIEILVGDREEEEEGGGDFYDRLLVRPKHQAALKEWRCFKPSPTSRIDRSSYGDTPYQPDVAVNPNALTRTTFHREEVIAIYLGACMSEVNRNKVLQVIRDRMEHVKVFQAVPRDTEFELEFKRIDSAD